jgi:alkylhydroperoxidase family enzyme
MLLAVAGLDDDGVTKRARQLASGDWSSLPPSEKAAFAYARKMSLEPWTLGPEDFERLVAHFGRDRAVDVVWWAARCQYMIRVADAFQLPLEKENVFANREGNERKKGEGAKK